MDSRQLKLAIGSLLHDVGKLAYRYNDGRNHSASGYDFAREQGIEDNEILEQIRFHHVGELRDAQLKADSLAYITYWADNVAAGADRRAKGADAHGGNCAVSARSFEKLMPLQSVFNVLNGNHQNFTYKMAEIYDSGEINFPDESEKQYSEAVYGRILQNIKEGLKSIELTPEYINSLLGLLEANLSFVPSSTDTTQIADISLYDHMKITAAVSGCMYEFLKEQGITDYQTRLFKECNAAYDEKAFKMLSLDISGIQEFIYRVDSSDALKTLRAKSFYLEIMLEHIVDELLSRFGLSRANLIYSGGGHAYILLPNTKAGDETLSEFFAELKAWYIKTFGIDLFVAMGSAVCSANALMDKPTGSYKAIFANLSRAVSENKARRYTVDDIKALNSAKKEQYVRECRVCGSTDRLNDAGLCPMCAGFIGMSSKVLKGSFVIVSEQQPADSAAVLLPFEKYMSIVETEDEAKKSSTQDEGFVRLYSKNRMFTGYKLATRLWEGDYHGESGARVSFEELAQASKGINRLGVLRADVDNLGNAFASGFKDCAGISRSATFSRKMSMFFKLHINHILKHGRFSMKNMYVAQAAETAQASGKNEACEYARHAVIVYSGGDDLFIVGAWDEIIEAAIDINEALKRYTQGMLTISAGIGMFPQKYPVSAMARQSGELEDYSKGLDGKNGITLFNDESKYKWSDFKEKVLGEKLALLRAYMERTPDKGNSMLYKLMSYVRESDEKINLARFAYLLGRLELEKDADEEKKKLFKDFSVNMYKWIKAGGDDKKQLLTAIYIYVYLNREDGSVEEKNAGEAKIK